MDPFTDSASAIRNALQAAASTASSANPGDVEAFVELRGQLKALEGQLQIASRHGEAKLCSIVVRMTESLISRQQPPLESVIDWVNGVVQHLGASLGVEVADEWSSLRTDAPAEKPIPSPPPRMGSLRMARGDGSRLGEILVQMSFLKPSDVERALQVQREKHCRLGEALVSLGLITQKGLDAALKIQQRKRVTGS